MQHTPENMRIVKHSVYKSYDVSTARAANVVSINDAPLLLLAAVPTTFIVERNEVFVSILLMVL